MKKTRDSKSIVCHTISAGKTLQFCMNPKRISSLQLALLIPSTVTYCPKSTFGFVLRTRLNVNEILFPPLFTTCPCVKPHWCKLTTLSSITSSVSCTNRLHINKTKQEELEFPFRLLNSYLINAVEGLMICFVGEHKQTPWLEIYWFRLLMTCWNYCRPSDSCAFTQKHLPHFTSTCLDDNIPIKLIPIFSWSGFLVIRRTVGCPRDSIQTPG